MRDPAHNLAPGGDPQTGWWIVANHLQVDTLATVKRADEPPQSPGSRPKTPDKFERSGREHTCYAP
jgi:hypothetical protein